jgi:hypothetical protein
MLKIESFTKSWYINPSNIIILNIQLTGDNFIQYLDEIVPEFNAVRDKTVDDSIDHYSIFWEFSSKLNELIDYGKDDSIKSYVKYIELMMDTSDEYVRQVMFDTVIESLALSGKTYYDAAKKYLSEYGFNLVEGCRKKPPLGKSPKYYL